MVLCDTVKFRALELRSEKTKLPSYLFGILNGTRLSSRWRNAQKDAGHSRDRYSAAIVVEAPCEAVASRASRREYGGKAHLNRIR
ncbi:hypothetical protein JZ751_005001 [Albula glossodonta]|uniref:Uncharacterized protein n=1 Tax=Albula glossodonta TaxID=121402 RepID=A0A8T2P4I8_9TELE|nr:hypothetical protein JZ751_005001 [Albula glossodonta]